MIRNKAFAAAFLHRNDAVSQLPQSAAPIHLRVCGKSNLGDARNSGLGGELGEQDNGSGQPSSQARDPGVRGRFNDALLYRAGRCRNLELWASLFTTYPFEPSPRARPS